MIYLYPQPWKAEGDMGERENSYLIFMGQKEAIARKNYF
jgi:hypothetical protein